MKLDEMLLPKLADWQPQGPGPHHLSVSADGWTGVVAAQRCDELGCRVWELTLRASAQPTLDEAGLRTWADRVACRVSGLPELLRVVEVDVIQGQALLRSREASRRKDGLAYFEVLLKASGEACCRRFRTTTQPKERREQVAFDLTHEVLAKLALDLVNS